MGPFWRRAFCLSALPLAVAAFGSPAKASTDIVWPLPPGLMDGVVGDDGQAIPVDVEGLPARRLSDGELHRLLLHLSRVMEQASLRLARCHAKGMPFGVPGWRNCIERR
jgi:hypothetical protein